METVQIALASDENYFPGLLVTAVTMARRAAKDAALVFHILDGGIGEERIEFLRGKLAAAHPCAELRRYPVETARFDAFPKWNCGSRMPYARLLLAETVDADFIIYSDVDFLWQADVAELWKLKDESRVLQACIDGLVTTLDKEGAWFRERGLAFAPERYVCTGLLIMNLKKWRAGGLGRRTMDFLDRHRDVLFVDQSAINAVVDDIGILPRKWGRFSRELAKRELGGEWAIHYAGGAPWRSQWWTSLITPADRLWYRTYGEICGISGAVWRKFIAPGEYRKRRFAYFLATTPVVRTAFFALLRAAGSGGYVKGLKTARARWARASTGAGE